MMRPEKNKPEPPASRQLLLLPMKLQIGDRLSDETGEWEVISRPYKSVGGKIASVHVRKVGRSEFADLRIWNAHERISVKRVAAEEAKP